MTEDRRKKIIQLNNCGHASHATWLTSWVKAQISPTRPAELCYLSDVSTTYLHESASEDAQS